MTRVSPCGSPSRQSAAVLYEDGGFPVSSQCRLGRPIRQTDNSTAAADNPIRPTDSSLAAEQGFR